jgi:hypothetical protein
VQIVIPEWTDNLVRESRYKDDLTYIGLGLSGLHPAVVFNAADWAELQRQVVQFRRYLSTLRQPSGKGVDLIFRYSRRDCGPVFDAAISQATGIAMRQSGDPPIRYLQNHWISTIGVSARTRCTYEAMKDEEWSESDSAQPAAGTSEVVLGY